MEFILLFAAILLIIFALSYFAFFRRNSKSKKICGKKFVARHACKLPDLWLPPFERSKHNQQSLSSYERSGSAMYGERLPKLFSNLQGGGKKNLPCLRKKHSSRRLFGFATFQQNARKKTRYDCWMQSMSAQRSQVIFRYKFSLEQLGRICYIYENRPPNPNDFVVL